MINHEECQDIVKKIANRLSVDQYEIMISGQDENLTRYANSMIHQNVKSESSRIQLRVIKNQQVGVSSCDNLSEEGLDFVIRNAMDICSLSKPDPEFISLPEPSNPTIQDRSVIDSSPDFTSPDYRADVVSKVCRKAIDKSVKAFGKMETNRDILFIANSLGIDQFEESTNCCFNTQIMHNISSGFAQTSGNKLVDLDINRVMDESLETCLSSFNLEPLDPGEYEVILKPEAAIGILEMLSYMGFSTLAIQEGRSYLSDKLGEQIFNNKLSIQDNSNSKLQNHSTFDFEGVAKKPVQIIKQGKFVDFVTDSKWAAKLNKPNTGHALPAPNAYGPFPRNLVIEASDQGTWRDMVKNAKKAILITRFWYTNPLHPKKGVCTGLTRDGTFLVQNGKIEKAIRNFRFTDNLVALFSKIIQIGADERRFDDVVSPSIHCESLRFVSQAEK
jgi:predicted Zn-dependent protease